jgi:hypothetical protein
MWQERELRADYRQEVKDEHKAMVRGVRNGFICAGGIFLFGFAMYWIVRLGT